MESQHEHQHEHEHNESDEVQITINNASYPIHRGLRTVADIKTVGHVPSVDQLDQLIDGTFQALKNDASVVIHGGEVFVSYPQTGASS